MAITFDPAKRDRTLRERGLDFREAETVFSGRTFEIEDTSASDMISASLRDPYYVVRARLSLWEQVRKIGRCSKRDYGERRIITVGHLNGRMVTVLWTARGGDRHIFSMRKTNGREQGKVREATLLKSTLT